MLGRRDAKYRTHALEALAELDTALPYGVVQGSEPPDHMVDWSISEEAGLYEILHYEPAEEEREGLSLVQQEVKKKWLKPADGGRRRRRRTKPSGKSKGGRPREPTTPPRTPQLADQGPKVVHSTRVLRPRPGSRCEVPPESTGAGSSTDAPAPSTGRLTLDEAADVWSIALGLALEEEVDAEPGVVGVVGRLLRVVGTVIEDAMAEEGSKPRWQPPEGDGSSFMQGSLITTPSDWEAFLADLRATLEQMSKGPRLANSVLWRWLEYRCADTASGRCLGHMQGRVAEMLALLVVAMEASAGVEEVPEWHEDWCNIWPELPVPAELPAPVLFMKQLPDMESADEALETEMRRAMRTNRAQGRDLDGEIEEERLTREADEEENAAVAEAEAAALAEEMVEVQRTADDWMGEEGLLSGFSPGAYQQWEDRTMQRAMGEKPRRKRTYLEVEVASGSADVALQLTATVVQQEEELLTQETDGPTTRATNGGPQVTSLQPEAGQGSAALNNGTGLGTEPDHGVATALDEGEPSEASTVRAEGSVGGVVSSEMRFAFTDISMADFERLYQQWVAGLVSLEEVQREHGAETRELLEVQRVAIEGGLETQDLLITTAPPPTAPTALMEEAPPEAAFPPPMPESAPMSSSQVGSPSAALSDRIEGLDSYLCYFGGSLP
eukprot:s3888_g3.t1